MMGRVLPEIRVWEDPCSNGPPPRRAHQILQKFGGKKNCDPIFRKPIPNQTLILHTEDSCLVSRLPESELS